MLTRLTVVIISQYTQILNHYAVHLKLIHYMKKEKKIYMVLVENNEGLVDWGDEGSTFRGMTLHLDEKQPEILIAKNVVGEGGS